jgi:hypothetical protein
MNDNALASLGGTGRVALGGLAQRLVQDGLVDEAGMQDAIVRAKEKRISLVTHIVASNLATARDIAISASNEFGVPLLDLDAVPPDLDAVRLVSEKLMQKHRVLPLMRRGKRLFLAVADPTNLHALDEIRFQTSMSIEFVVVEDDKLQMAVGKAIEQADVSPAVMTRPAPKPRAAMMWRMRRSCASSTRSCSTRSEKAHRTSTSSLMKRSSASARASTVCSRRWPCRRCSSR